MTWEPTDLPPAVLRYRSRVAGHLAAVQLTRRVPARRSVAWLSRTGYPPHPGSHLRSHTGPRRATLSSSPVAKLGWFANQKPFARQHLRLAIPNFAEVGFRPRHMILNYQLKILLLQSNFGIQAKRTLRPGV